MLQCWHPRQQALSLSKGPEVQMVSRVRTVAFQGIEALPVDVQVMIAPGKMNIQII